MLKYILFPYLFLKYGWIYFKMNLHHFMVWDPVMQHRHWEPELDEELRRRYPHIWKKLDYISDKYK